MMYHIKTFMYALAISVALLAIMAKLDEGKTGWCAVNMGNSTATMPCTELNQRVYEVTL
jgi:hypothetical protein